MSGSGGRLINKYKMAKRLKILWIVFLLIGWESVGGLSAQDEAPSGERYDVSYAENKDYVRGGPYRMIVGL